MKSNTVNWKKKLNMKKKYIEELVNELYSILTFCSSFDTLVRLDP